MEHFTPVALLIGGALIGFSAVLAFASGGLFGLGLLIGGVTQPSKAWDERALRIAIAERRR